MLSEKRELSRLIILSNQDFNRAKVRRRQFDFNRSQILLNRHLGMIRDLLHPRRAIDLGIHNAACARREWHQALRG